MNPHLSQAVAQSRQQDLVRELRQRRVTRELPRRPSAVARVIGSIPSLSFGGGRSAEVQHSTPAAIDA